MTEAEVLDVLRKVLDIATQSMDFGSGFLDEDDVQALRKAADLLHMDPMTVTPLNMECRFNGQHSWSNQVNGNIGGPYGWWCTSCSYTSRDRPTDGRIVREYPAPEYGAVRYPRATT